MVSKSTRRSRLALTSCLLALAIPLSPLQATVLLPAEFREIVGGSEIIVYGRVAQVESEMSPDRKRIESVVTLDVGTYLKGGEGETLTFRLPGGQVGRYRSVMVGAPTFAPGDEAIFFLRGGDGAAPVVFGLNQGVFRIQREERTGRRMVMPPLVSRGDAPQTVVRGAGSRQPMTLEVFGAEVRAIIAELERSVR